MILSFHLIFQLFLFSLFSWFYFVLCFLLFLSSNEFCFFFHSLDSTFTCSTFSFYSLNVLLTQWFHLKRCSSYFYLILFFTSIFFSHFVSFIHFSLTLNVLSSLFPKRNIISNWVYFTFGEKMLAKRKKGFNLETFHWIK